MTGTKREDIVSATVVPLTHLDTFHLEIFLLNDVTQRNILDMSVTLDTSHSDTSPGE